MSQTICPLPFSHQHVQPNGEIRFCCAARPDSNKNVDGRTLNVNQDTLLEAWNSPSIKNLRLDLIQGKTPEECNYCWERENAEHTQGTSMRIDFLSRIPINTVQDRIDYALENNGEVNQNPFDFQIMSGNLCNLSCKMCTPQYSTSYSKFYSNKGIRDFKEIRFSQKYMPSDIEETHFNATYDWPNTNPLNIILQDYFDDIQSIFLIGGEPTIIEGTFNFLEHIIELGYQKKIYPWISTNCTNINKKLIDLLDQFDRTGMNLSLDGMDEIAYIQRTPSNWNQIQSNVDKLIDWAQTRKRSKFTNFNVHSVVTSLNIHHIASFWLYLIERYSTRDFSISFMPVVEQYDNFSIGIIPKKIAELILEETKQIQNKLPENFKSVFDRLIYTLETTEFTNNFDNIHFQLDQIQKFHPDMDIKRIYSIYY